MPLTHFLGLIALVIVAAGLTLWLALWTGVPFAALAFAAISASVILTWTRVSR
jgi:spore coat polysaccharide biosynthesis predicted glycosyltransferase SpsG